MPASTTEMIGHAFRNLFSGWEERALREGKDILKTALQDTGYGVWEWTIKNNKVNFSRRWKSSLGYQAQEIGQDISEWEKLVHPDDREKTFTEVARLVRGETKTGSCEYRILCKDGSYRWVLDMARVISKDGKPLRLIAMQTDITRQKQNEEMLRESEEKYRILLEESSDPIFTFNPDCTFKYANRAFARAVDMESGAVIGQSVWHMFPQDEANRIHATVNGVFAGGSHRVIEMWVPKPDGDHYYMTSIEPVKTRDGRVGSVMCTSKDITKRKKAEEELLKSRDLTAKVFGNFPMAVYMKDYKNDGQYVIGNRMWDDLHRNAPMLSTVISEFEDAALSTGSAVIFEHTVPTTGGLMKTMKSNLIPLYDQNGRLEYLLGMSEDITDLKNMEADLAAKDAALAHASTEKAISALVAGLSHDINNALGGITGGQDLTKMYLTKSEKALTKIDAARSELARILRAAKEGKPDLSAIGNNGFFSQLENFLDEKLPKHLTELKTNLGAARKYLTYVDNGGLVIRDVTSGIRDYVKRDHSLGSFEIRPAIRGAVSLSKGQYKPMAQDQGKTVTVEVCDASPPVTVFGNAGEFMGVVVNLINNAVAEFLRGGNNRICISWEKGLNAGSEDIILVRVANDGPAIPDHVLARMFSEKVRSTHGGSGIGLLAVKSTLDRFGARIRHTTEFFPPEKNGNPASKINHDKTWTTFEMELLVSGAQEESHQPPKAPPVPRKILVVDDEKYMLDIMDKYAENLGHSAVIFNDPKEALEWYMEHSDDVDVVISDQCMPNMNGCELISNMKRCEPNKTFMIMTGHGALTLSREDTRDVHLLVRKPFDQRQLNAAIEDAVEKRDQARGPAPVAAAMARRPSTGAASTP
ncbi:MAG: PAS domain S-box protein [Deltaproteobacteria bacterium]